MDAHIVPMLAIVGTTTAMVVAVMTMNWRHARRRRRDWESGSYGAAGLGGSSGFAAGSCSAAGSHGGSSGVDGGCAGSGAGGCSGGGGCGGGCGGGD
jgi:hypothetical protein